MSDSVSEPPALAPSTRQSCARVGPGGLLGLLATLRLARAESERSVLAIVFAVDGSTYQKPGALVLLGSAGTLHGVISGGCLEPELEDRARKVLASGRAQIADFDTRSDEDRVFGSGTGCRGRIRLMLLPQPRQAPLVKALEWLARHPGALEIRLTIRGADLGAGTAALRSQMWAWDSAGAPVPAPAHSDPETQVLVPIQSPPRVLLLGAGPETPALCLFMQRLGWQVSVVEFRGRWLRFARAGGASRLLELRPAEAAEIWRSESHDTAIAMAHNYALDLESLRQCAASNVSYIGLLGPAARGRELLQELGPDVAARLGSRLHSPVGLGLGGSGPEALAISIVAELQQHLTRLGRLR